MGYWSFLVGPLIAASVIFPEPLWGLERGWQQFRACRHYLKDGGTCRNLAMDAFRRSFPQHAVAWPACGKDDVAEAILWAAVSDRVFVDRYMGQFKRLCP